MQKSEFQKAKEITLQTKLAVLERQGYKSVINGKSLTLETASFHHFLERGQSGVGYEWNIVAMTWKEHRVLMHDKQTLEGITPEKAEELVLNHFKENYNNWSRDNCRYHKWYAPQDYGVTRKENGS